MDQIMDKTMSYYKINQWRRKLFFKVVGNKYFMTYNATDDGKTIIKRLEFNLNNLQQLSVTEHVFKSDVITDLEFLDKCEELTDIFATYYCCEKKYW